MPKVNLNVSAKFGDQRLPKRFWDKVQPTVDGCWEWMAYLGGGGYGQYAPRHKHVKAHRHAYETLVGEITEETLDHLCRNRACVNPWHLEPVPFDENVRRGVSPPAMRARQTECKRGHPLSGDNLIIVRNGRGRHCRACCAAGKRAYSLRNMDLLAKRARERRAKKAASSPST